MDEKGTDPRILMLIYAALNYIEAKKQPVNPFVQGFGITEEAEKADDFLINCLMECTDYFPEVNEMVEAAFPTENTDSSKSQIEN